MSNHVKILSMNVRGLFSNYKKRSDVFNWAKSKNMPIVCFQETHSTAEVEKRWEDEWGGKCYFSHGDSKSAGVSVMFRNGFDFVIHQSLIDQHGRYILLDLTIYQQRFTLVCLYGHNTDRPDFFSEILQKSASFKNTSLIFCGDWNVVQDKSLDTYNVLHERNQNARKKVEELKEVFELLDPWRICFPSEKKFTWRQKSPIKQSRIDYFLVSEDLFSLMEYTKIIPGYRTDHSAIIFSFNTNMAKRGRGYWKFNSQLLKDTQYVNIVKKCIADTVSEYFVQGSVDDILNLELSVEDQMFFEILKMKIRSISIEYSVRKSREEKDTNSKLEQDIQNLENEMNSNPSLTTQETLNKKKGELENVRQKIIDGLLLRSRANWHENGEKGTEYFCKLEKKSCINKTISELIDDAGNHVSDPSKILSQQKDFYQKLYSTRSLENENCEFFFQHDVKLSDEQKNLCEGNLSFRECGEALKNMKNGKSPGSDGFTVDFYKFFWKDLGAFVFRSLFKGYELGHFSQFQSQGVITCIPKEGKDRRYLGNWRPISLLNTDLKIASAAIANRLKQVLFSIISDTQKGFMKGRFMGENTRLLFDLMHYLEENDLEGLLLLVDFEKAFDSIEWHFLKKALKSFNFGPSICKWFDTFYADSKSCVINNGHMSEFFSLERGCRQGDPLSPYLFIIGVELLSIQLKSNNLIRGIVINDSEPLVSQYADDTFLMLDGSERSLKESLSCFEKFYMVSGLKMNTSKTRAVWVGNKKYCDLILCPEMRLNWSSSNFKILGIEFSLDLSCMSDLNFRKKIIDISKILKSWQHRKLTLLGKITVIKTLALPKLIHLFTSLPNLKEEALNELNKLFFNFIWDGKSEKIKRNTLIADCKVGGLKMVHLQSFNAYLKVSWIKRYFSNLCGCWQTILTHTLKKYGGTRSLSLQKNKLVEISKIVSNPFWKDFFFSLHLAKPHVKYNMKECLSLDILNFVTLGNFSYYTKWENVGIKNLCHLFDISKKDFYTFQKIKEMVQTDNFMMYYTLISNIPSDIKKVVRENIENVNIRLFDPQDSFVIRIMNNNCIKFIYSILLENVVHLPMEKIVKWEDILECDIADWSKYFIILNKCCNDTYLKNFQYKFLHRVVPTNSFLFKINIVSSKLCSFCNSTAETVEHLFYDCPVTLQFLNAFFDCLRQYYNNIVLNKKHVFFGILNESMFLNLMIIIVKNYIYKCKLNSKIPSIVELKFRIKRYYVIERYISRKNGTMESFEKKWTPIRYIFPNFDDF